MTSESAVFGLVTVTDGVVVEIVKSASEASVAVFEPFLAVTQCGPSELFGPAGVQMQLVADPGRAVHAAIGVNVAPLLRESSTSNDVAAPVLVQRITVGTFANTRSPPLGATRFTARVSVTSTMVTLTVAMFDTSAPSLTWKVKVSVPAWPDDGVYVNAPVAALVTVAVPREPLVTMPNDKVGESTSLATSVPETGTFSSVVTALSLARGASLTGVIVTVTVAMFESVVPSLTRKVNVSLPVALAFGV